MQNELEFRQALEGIQKLHQKDIAASRKRDFDSLRALLSEEAIILPHGRDVIRGERELSEWFSQMRESMEDFEILEYSMDFQDIQIQGAYAFEWGYSREAVRNTRTGEIQRATYKLLRILRKEAGEWKVYRSIWNE